MSDDELPEAFLVQIAERGQREVHALRKARLVLGRAADSDVVLTNAGVSRHHALLTYEGGGFQLEDLGSTNGTRVNGASISGPTAIKDGDEIDLADCRLLLQMTSPDTTIILARPSADLEIDLATHEVRIRGKGLELTPKEFMLLALLSQREGAVVSRDDIAREVWPELGGEVPEQNVQQVVARLRRRLREAGDEAERIVTVRGFGYRLDT